MGIIELSTYARKKQSYGKCNKCCTGLEINEPGRVVRVDGEIVNLSPKEFELLTYLADNENIILTRHQILDAIWSYDYSGNIRTVDTHIKRLRTKLGNLGELIATVKGVGYKFELRK